MLSDLNIKVDGSAFYPSIEENYDTGNLPFLRVGDVNGPINLASCLTIPAELCDQFPTLRKVKSGDIVFTKGGAIDRVGYVTGDSAVSRDLIFLNTSKMKSADRLFLFSFFETPFFKRSLIRSSSQTAQPHLTITLVRNLPIYWPSAGLRSKVSKLVAESHRATSESGLQQAKAETALLNALGLAEWTPPEPLTYTASAADVFAAARLDAQFYAPRIRVLLDLLARDGRKLSDIAKPRRVRFNASKCDEFHYIEIGDMEGGGGVGSTLLDSADAPSRATWHVRPGDVLTSTVRPIRRLSAIVALEQDDYVASSGFAVLQPTGVTPEVLMTFLRLPAICELMDLYASASMYPAISEADILGLPIPTISDALSATVTEAVQSAFAARARSRALLGAAKRSVEIAIEEGETVALAYLAKQTIVEVN